MDKKAVYHIIGWIVALAACGYLVYRLAISDDYPSLWASLVGMGWQQYLALALCVLLMPVNMSIEAWKWKTLIPMTWYEAHREVYYSKLAGLVTPWRLGEYPSRALLRGEWKQTLSMGAVGSATMTIAIIAAGLAAMLLEIGYWRLEIGYYLLVGAVLILLILALVFAPRLLRRWTTVSHRLILVSVAQSFIRLACWCLQLFLVLYALGAIYHVPFTMYHLPIYYLLVTITPNVPIAEVGVRGSWAIVLFGSMNAALAGVLLWGINTLLPCLISLFFAKNNKTFA